MARRRMPMSDIREELEILEDSYKELLETHKREIKELIGELLEDIVFYLENKKNHNDKFYVYWSEMRKKWEKKKK